MMIYDNDGIIVTDNMVDIKVENSELWFRMMVNDEYQWLIAVNRKPVHNPDE